jgi:hypothetical protein
MPETSTRCPDVCTARKSWKIAEEASGLTLPLVPLSLASAGGAVPLTTGPGVITGLLRAAHRVTSNSAARVHVSSPDLFAVRVKMVDWLVKVRFRSRI